MRVQRVAPLEAGEESWKVLGDDWRQVAPVERFLSHLTDQRRSPNTVKAYARDLKDYIDVKVTTSVGTVAITPASTDLDALLHQADQAMYAVKHRRS